LQRHVKYLDISYDNQESRELRQTVQSTQVWKVLTFYKYILHNFTVFVTPEIVLFSLKLYSSSSQPVVISQVVQAYARRERLAGWRCLTMHFI
jgi:hypothetical protein